MIEIPLTLLTAAQIIDSSNPEQITERIKAHLQNPVNKVEGGFSMDNIQAVAIEMARIIAMDVKPIPDDVFLDTAEGIMLDRKAIDFYESRIEAKRAAGELKFEGISGTIIPQGTIAAYDSLQYETLEVGMIQANGSSIIRAQCTTEGLIGNADADTITTLVSSLSGINSVNNQTAFAGGVDREDDEHFRNRIIEKIQKPITSGNANHYEYWAKKVAGVGKAKVIPLWSGGGTVKVIVLSSENDIPSGTIIKNVSSYIDENRPIGATVTVVKASAVSVVINATIIIQQGYSLDVIKASISYELSKYLNEIAFDDSKNLSYFKIGDIIFGVEGVIDITDYTINGGRVSLSPRFEEFFKLQEVVINAS